MTPRRLEQVTVARGAEDGCFVEKIVRDTREVEADHERDDSEHRHVEGRIGGVERRAAPVRAAAEAGVDHGPASGRRGVDLPPVEVGEHLLSTLRELVACDPLTIEGRRLRRSRLRQRRPFARRLGLRRRNLVDRPHRLAAPAVEDEDPALLRDQGDGGDVPAADRDVDQVGRRREVEVPDVVVDDLVVPDAAARPGVEADQAVGEQVVALPVAAVEVVRRRADGQVDIAELRVGSHRRPHVRSADALGGAVLPGRVAELPRSRHGVEGPQELSGSGVVAADIARRPLGPRRPVHDRRADDQHVADHCRRRGVSVLV